MPSPARASSSAPPTRSSPSREPSAGTCPSRRGLFLPSQPPARGPFLALADLLIASSPHTPRCAVPPFPGPAQVGRNVVHGSDSAESAEREIGLWFKAGEVQEWKPTIAPWTRE